MNKPVLDRAAFFMALTALCWLNTSLLKVKFQTMYIHKSYVHMSYNCFKALNVFIYYFKMIITLSGIYCLYPLSNRKFSDFSLIQPAHTFPSKTWQITASQWFPSELLFLSLVESPTDFLLFVLTHVVF